MGHIGVQSELAMLGVRQLMAGGLEGASGVGRHKPPHTGWMNKVLLAAQDVQSISYRSIMEKNFKKEYIDSYI